MSVVLILLLQTFNMSESNKEQPSSPEKYWSSSDNGHHPSLSLSFSPIPLQTPRENNTKDSPDDVLHDLHDSMLLSAMSQSPNNKREISDTMSKGALTQGASKKKRPSILLPRQSNNVVIPPGAKFMGFTNCRTGFVVKLRSGGLQTYGIQPIAMTPSPPPSSCVLSSEASAEEQTPPAEEQTPSAQLPPTVGEFTLTNCRRLGGDGKFFTDSNYDASTDVISPLIILAGEHIVFFHADEFKVNGTTKNGCIHMMCIGCFFAKNLCITGSKKATMSSFCASQFFRNMSEIKSHVKECTHIKNNFSEYNKLRETAEKNTKKTKPSGYSQSDQIAAIAEIALGWGIVCNSRKCTCNLKPAAKGKFVFIRRKYTVPLYHHSFPYNLISIHQRQ